MGSSASRVCGTGALGVVKLHREVIDPAPTPDIDSTSGDFSDEDDVSHADVPVKRHQIVEIADTGGTEVTWSDLICREKGIVIEQVIPPINTAYVGLYSSKKESSKVIQRFDSICESNGIPESTTCTNSDEGDDDTDDVTSVESAESVTLRANDDLGTEFITFLFNELIDNVMTEMTEKEMSEDKVIDDTKVDSDCKSTSNALEDLIDSSEFDTAEDYLNEIENASRKNDAFFDKFPTPKVLRTAQESWEANRVVPPRDDSGRPLPYPYVGQEAVVSCGIEAVISSLKARSVKESVNLRDVLAQIQTSCSDKEGIIRCVFSLVHFAQRCELEDLVGEVADGKLEADMLRVHVFNYICRSMDIQTATISGYHKLDTVDIDTDDKQQKLSLWSAVLLDDIWKYIDTNRRSVFRDEKHLWKVYRPSFCTSWLVSPLCFIQTHLPQKRYWQQLSRPVSKSEWDNMVFLTPHFFHYNLQLHSHNRYEISCDEESFTVLFRYMERNQLLFEAKLLYRGNPVQISLPKNCSCTFVETRISDTSELVVRVVPPHPGEFVLAIFGLDILEDPYKCMHLCSYKIRCNKRSDDVTLFPSVSQGRYQWGPGADTLKAGLFPANCFDSSVVCEGPSLHLKFRISSDSNNVDLVSTMTGGDNFEDNLNRHVFFWVADGLAHFLVHSPGPGRYVLNICQKMRNTTVAICSYLLEFRSTASDVVLPPGFTANKLGTTKTGLAAGFEKKEWLAAFSTAPATGELVLNPVFDHDQVTNSYIQLRLLGRDCMDMTLYTKCNLEENNLSCTILLPRVGTYLLSLHVESVNGSTTCWHNAIIIAEVPCSNWAPFPSRTRDVPIDFCLHSPLSGQIPAKSQVTFSLQLNEAHDVAVVTSGGWFHLEKSISNSSLWTGNVNTGARGTDMKLCARFESGSGTFTPLCIYKVISGDEYESRSRQQSSLRETLLQRTDTNVR